jgi:hypothetical protein
MDFTLIEEYTDLYGNEIVICDFDPHSNMIPKVRDQWQQLPNGNFRVWMTREVFEQILHWAFELEREMEVA